MPFIFAAFTSRLPAELEEEPFMLMAEGFESYSGPAEIPRESMSYVIVLVGGGSDLERARQSASETWRERYGFPVGIELLESRVDRFIRGVRKTAQTLNAGDVVIRFPVIAYCTANDHIRDLSLFHLRKALTRQPWQIWR